MKTLDRIVGTMFLFSISLLIAANFAIVAGTIQDSNNALANTIGFTGLGIGCIMFILGSIWIWRK